MNKKTRLKKSNNKVVEYREQGNVAFQLLVKSQKAGQQVDVKELMKFQLTTVPTSIATADNFLAKTDKSKGFHYLTKDLDDADIPPHEETLTVIDGNAEFHKLQQVPANFREICHKLYDMMPRRTDVLFSTYMYKEASIKAMERKR